MNPNAQCVEEKSNKHKKHEKDHQRIKVTYLVTLGGNDVLFLKSYKIRYPMKNFRNLKLPFLCHKIPYFVAFQTKRTITLKATYFNAVVVFSMFFFIFFRFMLNVL